MNEWMNEWMNKWEKWITKYTNIESMIWEQKKTTIKRSVRHNEKYAEKTITIIFFLQISK